MASYQADIQIGVKGKAQLNQLESQLTRVNKAVKELNKALVLKTRAQTIKLNTKGAMNAVRDLENRINRLGRTIDVRLRTTEDRRERSSSSQSGGGGRGVVLAVTPQAARQAADGQNKVAQAYEVQTREAKGLIALEQKRDALGDQRIAQKKELAALTEKQTRLAKELNTVENSANEKAKTANRNRIFGGRTSKAGNSLSPLQAQRAQEAQLGGVSRSIEKLNGELQRTERNYENLSKTSARYYGAERRRAMEATDALEEFGKKQDRIAQRRQTLRNARAAAGVGLGAAATQIPGLGGVASGALGGAAVGGPVGAAVGGLVGGITDATRALVGFGVESGKFFNQLQLSRKALANTVSTTEEYKQALAGIRGIAQDFGGGIDNITSSYTKLNAAARSSGFTVEEVTETYRGLAAANTALGGNSERLQGILLATQQVFSKGKVQAEELRGQIGERLAGAFAKFAKSAGLSTSQLDKALEKGEVSLKDFQRFAKSLLEEYEEDAKKLYKEPENAAQRLDDAMKDLKAAMGPIVQDLMVMFTNLANAIVTQLTRALNAINNARLQGQRAVVAARKEDLRDRALSIQEAQAELEPNSKDGRLVIPNFTAEAGLDAAINSYKQARKAFEREGKKLTKLEKQLGDIDVSGSDIDTPLDTNTNTSKSGGGSKSVRESRVPELQRELALEKELFRIQDLFNQAELDGNEELKIRLQTDQKLARLAKQELDIRASDIPDNEKILEILLNQLAVRRAVKDEAQQLASLEKSRKEAIEEALLPLNQQTELLQAELEGRADKVKLEQEAFNIAKDIEGLSKDQVLEILEKNKALQDQVDILNQMKDQAAQLSQIISDGLVAGLKGVVDGTKSAEEAMKDMINSVADIFLQRASEMIAKAIEAQIFSLITGLLGGPSSSSSGFGSFGAAPSGLNTGNMTGFFNPNVFKADGGPVSSGSPYIVGERGPELFVPSRSGTVISNEESRQAMSYYGNGSGGGTFRLETTVINGVEYATVDQVRAMGNQAARQGAAGGNAMTMNQLRNSRSQRSKLGMS